MEFPITIATVPFRIPNSPNQPVVFYGQYAVYCRILRIGKIFVLIYAAIFFKIPIMVFRFQGHFFYISRENNS